jgi:hypothetical protein
MIKDSFMKKTVFSLISIFITSFISVAQTPQELMQERMDKIKAQNFEYNKGNIDTSHRYFYKTYADFISNNPVQGSKYTGQREILLGSEAVLVLENDDFVEKKMKELKYWGFLDEWAQLLRIFDNHSYYVLDTGKICTYIKAIDVVMITDKYGKVTFNWLAENPGDSKDYFSEGMTGKIEDFSDKKFQILTSSHPELFEQYIKEPIDNKSKDKRSLKTLKIKKYVDMFNKME